MVFWWCLLEHRWEMFLRSLAIVILIVNIFSCKEGDSNLVNQPSTTEPRADSTFDVIHAISEDLYNGNGTWGRGFDYRMALRDSYWRADVYGEITDNNDIYFERTKEVHAYLMLSQAEGGSGVFGFPADINNPEFGEVVNRVLTECPECINNGWVVSLPGDDVAELYYDHGYALVSLVKGYLNTNDSYYLSSIMDAADWILNKPLHSNVNYLSALSKGLSYAYRATGDLRYLDRAIFLHEQGIFPNLSRETGGALDSHNQQLEYHGFIVSGIIALKSALPSQHDYHATVDRFLNLSISHMQQRNMLEDGSYGVTWPGTNLLAWHELEKLRELTSDEKMARDRCIDFINSYKESIVNESDFRLQKSLYSNFFIGLYPD